MTNPIQDSATPAQGQQIITACALIHHTFDGVTKVFLPKRAETKKFLPSVYEIPGGHIDYGEDIIEGLRREIREELNFNINVGDPFYVFDYTNEIKGSQSIEVIYFASLEGEPGDITLNPDDHSAFGWFSENDMHKAYTDAKGADDQEFIALKKAFTLLSGVSLNFGG